jgi:hypothetical protein
VDSKKLKFTVVLHIGQPVKIVVAEPDRVIVAEHKTAPTPPNTPETANSETTSDTKKRQVVYRPSCCKLAHEFLNDWEAIMRVVETPTHPLTNNTAERSSCGTGLFCVKSPSARAMNKAVVSLLYLRAS